MSSYVSEASDRLSSAVAARSSTSVRVAQLLGLTLAAHLTGTIASASTMSVPAVLHAPRGSRATVWKAVYERGRTIVPSGETVAGAIFAWLAVKANHNLFPRLSLPFGLSISFTAAYAVASAVSLCVLPATLVFISPTNNRLLELAQAEQAAGPAAKAVSKADEEELDELLQVWTARNSVRGLFALSGTVLAGWAAINWPSWNHL